MSDFIRHCIDRIIVDSATQETWQPSSPVSYASIIAVNPVLATPVDKDTSSGRHGAVLARLISHPYRNSMPVGSFPDEFNCAPFVAEAD